jgi:hypothetical protein
MSSSIAKLALAQTKVQKEIKDLPKESKGFAHKYTTFDKLVQYLRPILAKHGISFIQMPCGENENVGVITLYMHTSGEYISSKVETQIIQAQNKYQSMGSAITYFKRYSLASFVGIASDEDTDGNVQKKEVKKPTPTTKPLTDEQFKTVIDTVKDENEEFRDKVTQAVKAQKLHQDNYMNWLLEYKESKTKEGKNGK